MTDYEYDTLKMIQMNMRGDINGLSREVLIDMLVTSRGLIDTLISIEDEKRNSST